MKLIIKDDADKIRGERLKQQLKADAGADGQPEAEGIAEFPDEPMLPDEPVLELSAEGLVLKRGNLALTCDFTDHLSRLKKSNLEHEMLLKAVRIKDRKDLYVLDAAAGLGTDALILSAAGFSVDLYEKDPVIAALLEDGFIRGEKDEQLSPVLSRMRIFPEDSLPAMEASDGRYQVIYLDPMFPERTKQAAVKKKFQLLHDLEKPCENEEEMFMAAVRAKPLKIVVKRPVKGAFLAGKKPDHSFRGKAVRYDCYINLDRLLQ